ncbi:glycoside hydrolase family 31 protein [Fibrella aquatilis]|uniref:Glycoside hydrolase n=1 Tax=Fibrella aquatilis TaxID=2817059 RepID=A0A939G4Q4_9BACT|nr:glycoside hydrolase family 31 protein [Fibrella aquatilis]MBO0931168.1 hypothetical protein [Fibrella aquatilis]
MFVQFITRAQPNREGGGNPIVIPLEPGEKWWGGVVSEGEKAPFGDMPYSVNLYGDNKSNQAQPLLLSNHGRYVWSEQPFAFAVAGKTLTISQPHGKIEQGQAGKTLREAYQFVAHRFFPADGKLPDTLLFTKPQWNTWIELTYNQNQTDVLRYAKGVLDHGFSAGVLMIDDTWQDNYGNWHFHSGRFPDPKAMTNQLHQMGFKVMLWICPFVSADSPAYRELRKKKALLLENPDQAAKTWATANTQPALIRWWNGASAVLDFTNPTAVDWFNAQLKTLHDTYGIDGFKFDAGDAPFYPANTIAYKPVLPNQQTELFGQFGLTYPLNEYRAMWKMAGKPLAQRLGDKGHTWEELRRLMPQVAAQGMMGYAFTCPDMIGGGDYVSFLDRSNFDQDLVVRSAQCHALMPMMQFSVAPWRILDKEHLAAVQETVALRQRMTPRIMAAVRQSANTGEPTMRHMEYEFPNQGFASVTDQFMIGSTLLVAPVTEKGSKSRIVQLPKGTWKADDGTTITGPTKITITTPINRLPYFDLMKPTN